MMVPEAVAKAKWCPFARSPIGEPEVAGNREINGSPDRGALCLGSGCMGWRWTADRGMSVEPPAPVGYCGLAGEP